MQERRTKTSKESSIRRSRASLKQTLRQLSGSQSWCLTVQNPKWMDGYVFKIAYGITMRQQKPLNSKLHYFQFSLLLIILIALSLLVSYPLPVYADNLPANDALNQAMVSMNTAMSSTPMTGNSDVDFAVMMISHHQGAIDMAKVELRYGIDSRLRRLAQEIIVTQQSEIALMQLAMEHPLSAQSSSSP